MIKLSRYDKRGRKKVALLKNFGKWGYWNRNSKKLIIPITPAATSLINSIKPVERSLTSGSLLLLECQHEYVMIKLSLFLIPMFKMLLCQLLCYVLSSTI